MTSKYSTFSNIYSCCLLCLVVILWQDHVVSGVSKTGTVQRLDWENQINVVIDYATLHERERRAVDVLPQDAPCSKTGGGGSMDYEMLGTRNGKYKSIGSKIKSAKNKLKKSKFLADGEERGSSNRRRRRQVEEEYELPANENGGFSKKAEELMERVKQSWISLKDTMKRLSEQIGQHFSSNVEDISNK